jgi:hypothetical protein
VNCVERLYVSKLAYLMWRFQDWDIGKEQHMWTAAIRPTPTSLIFVYAPTLDGLERKMREAEPELP